MSSGGAGLRALSVEFPPMVRTNDYWRQNYPEVVEAAQQKALSRLWSQGGADSELAGAFEEEMRPYLADPFRGTVERRVLLPGQGSLGLELRAAQRALAAAAMSPSDVDLLLVASFLPDTLGVGNAAYLAKELGLRGAAFNLESACSSALVALQTATALVRAGEYRNALVAISCTYSRVCDDRDTLSWTVGDGAAAFVVGALPDGEGVLGTKSVHTGRQSCGALAYELERDEDGAPALRMRARPEAGRALREISETCLRPCCEGAAKAAGVSLEEIDFFVFNSPVAWYAPYCARGLGIDKGRTLDTYREYGNVGPVLMPANLHRAASTGRIRPGDLVLVYTVGSVSSAGAAVMRWGDVRLG